MGLNICIENIEEKDLAKRSHPDWDDGRYSGDRQLFDIIAAVPGEYRDLNEVDWVWRPTDFSAFRAADWPDVNAERWIEMADILEADDRYWIFMSV